MISPAAPAFELGRGVMTQRMMDLVELNTVGPSPRKFYLHSYKLTTAQEDFNRLRRL